MIYVLTEIFNYRQLIKIGEETIDSLKTGFNDILDSKKCRAIASDEGLFLFTLGPEQATDPKSACDSIFRIYGILDRVQAELYGFAFTVSILEDGTNEAIIRKIRDAYFSLEAENGIWITQVEKAFFGTLARYEQHGTFFRLLKSVEREAQPAQEKKPEWKRHAVANAILEGLEPQINNEQEPHLLFISGPKGSGKTTAMYSVSEKLVGKRFSPYVPFLYTRFRKKSFHHPFINSISPSFLGEVSKFLSPLQKNVWKEHDWLLEYLKSGLDTEKCPDHLYEDFCIEYTLYLSAYLELAKKNIFPGLFICDDVEKYHAHTLTSLYKLIRDYQKYPYFFPILISSQPELPDEINKLPYTRVDTGSISASEIKHYSKSLFPGLEIPKKTARELAVSAKGQIPLVYQLLVYLERTGRIKKSNSHFEFVHPKTGEIRLPAAGALVPWFFSKGLSHFDRDILYLVYLASGLFNSRDFEKFLEASGFDAGETLSSMEKLLKAGLIIKREFVYSAYPSLKKRLEETMGQRSGYLADTFIEYLTKIYKSGVIANYVLLFSCFFGNNRRNTAVEILSALIKRKIDELNLGGVKPFLNTRSIALPDAQDAALNNELRLIMASGKLRYLIVHGSFQRAEKLAARIMKSERSIQPSDKRGTLFLTLGKFFLSREDTQNSITYVKKALLDFEEHGDAPRKAEAYYILTSAMLKEGKLDNAVDYLVLSVRLMPENRYPYEQIQITCLAGIAAFLQGNLTKAMFEIERARALARSSGRRSWELFLSFITNRIFFEYGRYEDAIAILQECLALTTIYSMKEAQPVLYSWLARNFVYNGDRRTGGKLLRDLPQTDEVLLFLAETYYFQSEKEKALETALRSTGIKASFTPLSIEKQSWENGFIAIEGKCTRALDKGSVFSMLKRSFCAYLSCLNGDMEKGVSELYNITRTEKAASADPYNHVHYYLYSLTLKEIKDYEGYDSLTILNKALKQLQERASKIEDPYDRMRYINNNYWNAKIIEAAKKKNLL